MVFPAATTRAAKYSLWAGVVSLTLLGLASLLVIGSILLGIAIDTMFGIATLLVVPAVVFVPIAMVLGTVALTQKRTGTTLHGEQHATIGLVCGVITIFLFCMIASLAAAIGGGR